MAMERDSTPSGKRTEYHKFVLSDVDNNNNKFWNVGLYDSGDVEIEFGRVGVTRTQGVHRGAGSHKMTSLINSKEKKGYRESKVLDGDFGASTTSSTQKVSSSKLKNIARDQIQHTSPATTKLIEWLAEVNRHNIVKATGGCITYNSNKGLFQTEQGIVTPVAISEARLLLDDISDYIAKGQYDSSVLKRKLGSYLMLIPQNVGMKLNVRKFLPDLPAVQSQGQILDALDASYVSATSQPQDTKKATKVDKTPKLFETKLIIVSKGDVFDRIRKFYERSRNRSHYNVYDLKVKKIWEVEIAHMKAAFELMAKRIKNVNELWHGTQASNLLSILKGGLVIPPSSSSHVTGRMFYNGIYFSDQSTKALNYATSFWGSSDIGRYFMFMADVSMGKYYVPSGPRSCLPPAGYDSYFAQGRKSGVQNNEMIVFKTSQVNLRYLVEFGK
jgi:poly [ADP-ribose] polymerase 2/3/4